MTGGSAALHLLAVASTPARVLLGLTGSALPAITCFGIAMGAPLYLAWRRQADREIVRASPHLNH
ncbi:MAG: hypothetical protein H0T79_23855 [Deltaproteobacteria bacterium]|nr:hypothetical protein [Deltaproteobacteria bacterium]